MKVASDGSDTKAKNTSKGRVLAVWLVGVHIVVGLVGCAVSWHLSQESTENLLTDAFVGLVFAQTSLLGIWGGLGPSAWLVRLTGVLIGLVYLGTLFSIGVDALELVVLFLLMTVFLGVAVTGLLALCRCFGFRIRAIGVDRPKKAQFSIRQLLFLTLIVACLCAVADWLELPFFTDWYASVIRQNFVHLLLIDVPFVILGLISVWAILGTKRLRLGIVGVLLLAPLLGFVMPAVVGDSEAAVWITATMTAALVLVVSLYVIRRCGFRVTRQPKGEPGFEGKEPQKEYECGE
jgi:hypothetical protein